MAQACNNIGKELSSSVLSTSSRRPILSSPPTMPLPSKQRKSNSPPEVKKTLKRSAPSSSPPLTLQAPPAKKMALFPATSIPSSSSSPSSTNPHSFYFPPSPFMFDSLLLHHLSKSFSSSSYLPTQSFGHSSNSAFSPSSHRSAYLVDSILAPLKPSPPAFVCNWMEANTPDGFCGKRFENHLGLLEHLCTAHTASSSSSPSTSIKCPYPTSLFSSYYSPTSVGKL